MNGEKSHHSYVLCLLLTLEGELDIKLGTGRLGMKVHTEPKSSVKNLGFGLHSPGNTNTVVSLNPLKTKRNLLYIRNQSVPRCKHFPPRL